MSMAQRRFFRVSMVAAVATLVGLLACVPAWRNYHLPAREVRIIEDVTYVSGSTDERHRLDLYLPRTSGPHPVVVFVHGGFWKPFDRRMLQPLSGLHGCVGVALANAGIATAVIGYRQRPAATKIQDALDDVARAVRYVSEHTAQTGGDPARLFVVGHSAGGLLAALLAVQPEHLARAGMRTEQIQGFASLAGPYDLERIARGVDKEIAAEIAASAPGADAARFSPERHVRPDHAPLLLLVGGEEEPGLLAEHRAMVATLRATGGNFTAEELPGEDHMGLVMHLSESENPTLAALRAFVDRGR